MNVLELVLPVVTGIVAGAFAAGGAWVAVRVELRYLRRDVDRAHDRLDRHEQQAWEFAHRRHRPS